MSQFKAPDPPDTDEVRDIWVDWHLNDMPRDVGIRLVPATQAQFDAWLATVRAEAWAEGYESGTAFGQYENRPVNPYRTEQ